MNVIMQVKCLLALYSSEKYPYPPHQRNYNFLRSPNHLDTRLVARIAVVIIKNC